MDTLPTSSSVSKTPAIIASSSSGTVHSRLTASNSNSRRLRAHSRTRDEDVDAFDKQQTLILHEPVNAMHEVNSKSPELPLYSTYKSSLGTRRRQFWIWIVYCYCISSVAFLTMSLLRSHFSRTSSTFDLARISPVNDFSLSYRLSKIMSIRPEPIAFYPFTLEARGPINSSDITICAWTDANDLQGIVSWSKQWTGPISIVVVANSSDSLHQFLSYRFPRPLRKRLNIHFLHIVPNTLHTPNAYLNLARMFSRTRLAVLFPAPLTQEPPSDSYSNITMPLRNQHVWNGSKVASPMSLSSRKFMPTLAQPFERFTPLLVDIRHPVWCSERFFTAPSREADWEECLWQFWVNSYGTMKSHPEVRWTVTSNTKGTNGQQLKPTTNELIHRHLVQQFRHETCVLAAKRLKDRTPKKGAILKSKQASWLRKICRQSSNGWSRQLLA